MNNKKCDKSKRDSEDVWIYENKKKYNFFGCSINKSLFVIIIIIIILAILYYIFQDNINNMVYGKNNDFKTIKLNIIDDGSNPTVNVK